jgi:Collagen triple helix repeat (20 copies)
MARAAKLGSLLSLLLVPGWLFGLNEGPRETKIQNWQAPAYWSAGQNDASGLHGKSQDAVARPPLPFVAMSPCRLADTRGNGFTGPFGVPFLSPGVARAFPVQGQCGIPLDAEAVSFNFTVVRTMGTGYLVAYPEGGSRPGTSNLNFAAGQIVANGSIVQIGATGGINVEAAGAQTDLLIDINGYYAGKIVSSLNSLSGPLVLAAGSNVTITPSGSTLTLNASSVPGPAGPMGPQGPMGIQGHTGSTGAQGMTGNTGAIGATGASGSSGAQGTTGSTGAQGLRGSQGGYQSFHDLGDLAPGAYFLSPLRDFAGDEELGGGVAHIPSDCTMTTISVFVTSPPEVGSVETYTLRVGTSLVTDAGGNATSDLADTTLTCSISPQFGVPQPFQSCSFVGSVPVLAGQIFDIRLDLDLLQPGKPHQATVAVVCE